MGHSVDMKTCDISRFDLPSTVDVMLSVRFSHSELDVWLLTEEKLVGYQGNYITTMIDMHSTFLFLKIMEVDVAMLQI